MSPFLPCSSDWRWTTNRTVCVYKQNSFPSKAWEREIITVLKASPFSSPFSYKEKGASLPAAGRGLSSSKAKKKYFKIKLFPLIKTYLGQLWNCIFRGWILWLKRSMFSFLNHTLSKRERLLFIVKPMTFFLTLKE